MHLHCILFHFINHFVSAGIDTSRFTLRFAVMHMAKYPEIQRKVQEEIDNVVGKKECAREKVDTLLNI